MLSSRNYLGPSARPIRNAPCTTLLAAVERHHRVSLFSPCYDAHHRTLMEKNFDHWNELKKQVNASPLLPLYHEREIWWAHLGVNVGYEQDGTGSSYERPVLILRGFSPHVCVVVPLTTSQKRDRFYITAGTVEGKNAAAIVSQIRLIDTRRLINKVGTLDRALFEPIRKAARKIL
jgi:mRNA interferase MazF